jgi:uncharacterized protein YecT (DUF1311 family)
MKTSAMKIFALLFGALFLLDLGSAGAKPPLPEDPVEPQEPRADLKQADEQHDLLYQQLLASLPADKRAQLLVAEAAWLDFVGKNNTAFHTTAAQRHIPLSKLQDQSAAEIRARCDQLRSILSPGALKQAKPVTATAVQQAEATLGSVYQQSLGPLTPNEANRLRETQDAWTRYVEANRALGGTALALLITTRRTDHLRAFYSDSANVR